MKHKINPNNPIIAEGIRIFQKQVAKALDADRLIENAVLPFYALVRDRPEQTGSCVALKIKDSYFLLTASHVIDATGNHGVLVGVGGGQRLAALGGERFSSAKGKSGTHNDDPVDASVFHIQSDVPAKIQSVALTLENLVSYDSDSTPCVYGSVGFRANKTRTGGSQSTVLYELFPSLEYKDDEYAELSLDKTYQLALAHEDLIWTGKEWQTSPQPRGFSGGAIIKFAGLPILPMNETTTEVRPLLSAITIEQRREKAGKPGVLIGTWINIHLGLIAKYLPALLSQ